MLHRVALLLIACLALAPLLATTAQEAAPVVLRLEGHEGPLACDPTALQLLCFTTVEGDPATAFTAGAAVQVELTAVPLEGAPAGAPHNLAVILDGEQGDLGGIDSDSANAIAISDTAESGNTVTLAFTVPASGTLYFWCDVGEHEFAGMNFLAEIQPPAATEVDEVPTNDTDDMDNDTADAPAADSGTDADDQSAAPEDNGTDAAPAEDADGMDPEGVEESPALPLVASLAAAAVGGALWRRRIA